MVEQEKERVYGHKRRSIAANRVRIPTEYSTFLSEKDVYAAPGQGGCFLLIPKSNAQAIFEQYSSDDPYFSTMQDFVRRINNDMFKVTIDSQQRMSITPEMKELCDGMDSAIEVVFCGRGNFIEVWPARVYDKVFAKKESLDDMIAALKAKLNK